MFTITSQSYEVFTAEIIDGVSEIVKGYGDVSSMQRIEELALDADEESKKKIKALYKSMSSDTKRIFQPHVKEILASE